MKALGSLLWRSKAGHPHGCHHVPVQLGAKTPRRVPSVRGRSCRLLTINSPLLPPASSLPVISFPTPLPQPFYLLLPVRMSTSQCTAGIRAEPGLNLSAFLPLRGRVTTIILLTREQTKPLNGSSICRDYQAPYQLKLSQKDTIIHILHNYTTI